MLHILMSTDLNNTFDPPGKEIPCMNIDKSKRSAPKEEAITSRRSSVTREDALEMDAGALVSNKVPAYKVST